MSPMPPLGFFANSPAGGDFESIATANFLGTSGYLEFTSIPATYKHLQIRYIAHGTTAGNATMQFNGDTGSNYSSHILYGQGSAAASLGFANGSFMYLGTTPAVSNVFNAGVIDILDYADTNKYKTTRTLCGVDDNSGGEIGLFSGSWRSTSAVNSIKISYSNFTLYSQFALYGIKG